jgi:hypothetical protein
MRHLVAIMRREPAASATAHAMTYRSDIVSLERA